MYAITVPFLRFEDISLAAALNTTAVYVIWDSQARAKPSYIGSGDLLARLSQHDADFAHPIRGFLAIFDSGNSRVDKQDTLLVETLLLQVARDTDRWPTHNRGSGNMRLVRDLFDNKGLIKIIVKGCDPFGHPEASRVLDTPKQIRFEITSDGKYDISHDWRYRKRLLG